MRDISTDLRDRADFLKEQIDAAQAKFDHHLEQIKKEHDSRLEGLKADLDAVNTLLGAEQRRLGNMPAVSNDQPQPQPQAPSQQQPLQRPQRPRLPLAEMIGLQQRVG